MTDKPKVPPTPANQLDKPAGVFDNGDHWTGEQYREDGQDWYIAVDRDGRGT